MKIAVKVITYNVEYNHNAIPTRTSVKDEIVGTVVHIAPRFDDASMYTVIQSHDNKIIEILNNHATDIFAL